MARGDTYPPEWRRYPDPVSGARVTQLTHHKAHSIQILHVHPRFSPDGRQVLYTCDPDGYGNVRLVEVPEFEALPALSD